MRIKMLTAVIFITGLSELWDYHWFFCSFLEGGGSFLHFPGFNNCVFLFQSGKKSLFYKRSRLSTVWHYFRHWSIDEVGQQSASSSRLLRRVWPSAFCLRSPSLGDATYWGSWTYWGESTPTSCCLLSSGQLQELEEAFGCTAGGELYQEVTFLRSSGGSSDLSVSLLRSQQTGDQVVNTIGFVVHMVSVHVQLCHPSLKAA